MKKVLFLVATLGVFATTTAQLKLDAEFRPRFEYRHGYKTLVPKDIDPAMFTSQRTRFNAGFKNEKITSYLSLQNISVWGDTPQLTTKGSNGVYVHQAWADVALGKAISAKIGRQEINYDDARILGNVGWAQQGRSHDALVFKYKKNKLHFHLGLAYNQSGAGLIGNTYKTPKNYKSLQYMWLHKNFDAFSGSLLFLNNGVQFIDKKTQGAGNETRYSQTLGTHLKGKSDRLSYNANLYYQFGKDVMDKKISAYLVGLQAAYGVSTGTKLILGGELQSGNSYDTDAKENKSFTPFYGTNHKFNGFMDYFYVGNHMNNVGLADVYGKAKFKLGKKSSFLMAVHNFMSAGEMAKDEAKQLGNELDLVYGYKMNKFVKINAGYSHMFASEGMELLKGVKNENTNNFAWVMVTIKPTLFSNKSKK